MKKNKEIKKGDKIWVNSLYQPEEGFYLVKSVRKSGTLVEVVVESKNWKDEPYDIVMYGHASSCLLSGYNKTRRHQDDCYTCDYSLVQTKKEIYDYDQRYKDAGRALLNLAKYLK